MPVEIYLVVAAILIVIITALLYYRTTFRERGEVKASEGPFSEKISTVEEVGEKELLPPEESIDLRKVKGIGPKRSERLMDEGIKSVQDLAAIEAGDLAEMIGVSEKRASGWIEGAKGILAEEKLKGG